MTYTNPQDHIAAFAEELLRSGLMLSELAAELVEILPADAYPGENPGHVVLDTTIGTIRSRLLEEDEHEVEKATDLIAAASDRVIEHLQLALALSRQMGHGETESRRGHG